MQLPSSSTTDVSVRSNRRKYVTDDMRTIKALRLMKGLSRKEAGALCGVSRVAFEQLENGRCNVSETRLRRYVEALGFTFEKFTEVRKSVKTLLHKLELNTQLKPKKLALPKRNYHRIITKEVRVIRVLRQKSGVSQLQAARQCGYARAVFGHIENGRIELPEPRLEHIVRCLGHDWIAFQKLMNAEVLRDELIEQCTQYLKNLDDTRLDSAATVIKALLK